MDLLEALALSLDVPFIDRTEETASDNASVSNAPPATGIEPPLAVLADAPPTIPEVPGLRGGKRKYFVSYEDGKRRRHVHIDGPVPLGERLAKAREENANKAALRKKAEMKELVTTVVNHVAAEAKVRVSVGVATWRKRLQRKV